MSTSAGQSPAVKQVAVLAAWCDARDHLCPPPVEQYLQEHKSLCEALADRWEQTNEAAARLTSTQSSQSSGAPRCRCCGAVLGAAGDTPVTAVSAAEQCQASVDALLAHYHAMVSAGGGSSSLPRGVAARPGLAGRLFLALCPSPPGPLTLRSLVNLVVAALTTAATATVLLSWVLVPLLCWVVRDALLQEDMAGAARMAGCALAWLVVADALHRAAAARKAAAAQGRVTAADVAAYIGPPPTSLNPGEVFLAPAPSTCLPPAAGGPAPPSPRRSAASAAGTSGGGGAAAAGGGAAGERAALRPVVAALQAKVYGPGAAAAAAASGDLVQDVAKLCRDVGVNWAPSNGSVTTAELHRAIKELQQQVGP